MLRQKQLIKEKIHKYLFLETIFFKNKIEFEFFSQCDFSVRFKMAKSMNKNFQVYRV